jgi:hypothetical protein
MITFGGCPSHAANKLDNTTNKMTVHLRNRFSAMANSFPFAQC